MTNTYFDNLRQRAAALGPVHIAVAGAMSADIIEAVYQAHDLGIVEPILVGPKQSIVEECGLTGLDPKRFEVVDAASPEDIAQAAIDMIQQERAELLMKGHLETRVIMKAVLKKENNFRTTDLISHVGLLSVPTFTRPFFVTDGAINISPSLEDKVIILRHAVKVAHAVGVACPNVAVLCPTETVNTKIPCTLDAQILTDMQKKKVFGECRVEGPYALDNAVSVSLAEHKGISGACAGKADILLVPDLMSGNILIKSMEHFAGAEKAGVLLGAKSPIVLTSRASSPMAKINSIALSVLIAKGAKA